tara:strand:- start:2026 stop:3516 length:1491 start_codon:yes stop_codon:yes gene_type:complete
MANINVQGFLDSLSSRQQGSAEEDLLAQRRQSISEDIYSTASKSRQPFKTSLAVAMGDTLGKGLLRAFNVKDTEKQRAMDTDQANKLIGDLSANSQDPESFIKIAKVYSAMNEPQKAMEAMTIADSLQQGINSRAKEKTQRVKLHKELKGLDIVTAEGVLNGSVTLAKGYERFQTLKDDQSSTSVGSQMFSNPQDQQIYDSLSAGDRSKVLSVMNRYTHITGGSTMPMMDALGISAKGVGQQVSEGSILDPLQNNLIMYANRQGIPISPKFAPGAAQTNVVPVQKTQAKVEQETEKKRLEEKANQLRIEKEVQDFSKEDNLNNLNNLTSILGRMRGDFSKYGLKQNPDGTFEYDENINIPGINWVERQQEKASTSFGGKIENNLFRNYEELKALNLKELSGVTVSDKEAVRAEERTIGLAYGLTDVGMVGYFNEIHKNIEKNFNTRMNSMSPEAQLLFLERNSYETQEYTPNSESGKKGVYRETYPGSGNFNVKVK